MQYNSQKMEVEKRRSKGRFLNLFDWNGKSRKKLFSNNSHLPGMDYRLFIWDKIRLFHLFVHFLSFYLFSYFILMSFLLYDVQLYILTF